MKKLFIVIGVILILLAGGFYTFNNHIYNEKQQDAGLALAPYDATLTGEYVCLPHKDTSGPQTDECAFGIKTDASEYYALDFNMIPEGHEDFQSGTKFSASGTITPIENLSTDHWRRYDIEGIFTVTDYVKDLPM